MKVFAVVALVMTWSAAAAAQAPASTIQDPVNAALMQMLNESEQAQAAALIKYYTAEAKATAAEKQVVELNKQIAASGSPAAASH